MLHLGPSQITENYSVRWKTINNFDDLYKPQTFSFVLWAEVITRLTCTILLWVPWAFTSDHFSIGINYGSHILLWNPCSRGYYLAWFFNYFSHTSLNFLPLSFLTEIDKNDKLTSFFDSDIGISWYCWCSPLYSLLFSVPLAPWTLIEMEEHSCSLKHSVYSNLVS